MTAAGPGAPPAAVLLRLRQRSPHDILVPVRGSSMAPAIPRGAEVWVSTTSGARQVGDVVLVEWSGLVLCHRVVRTGRGWHGRDLLLTRGDSVIMCDVPVTPDAVLGTVTALARDDARLPLPAPLPLPGWRGPVSAALLAITWGLALCSLGLVKGMARVISALRPLPEDGVGPPR